MDQKNAWIFDPKPESLVNFFISTSDWRSLWTLFPCVKGYTDLSCEWFLCHTIYTNNCPASSESSDSRDH